MLQLVKKKKNFDSGQILEKNTQISNFIKCVKWETNFSLRKDRQTRGS